MQIGRPFPPHPRKRIGSCQPRKTVCMVQCKRPITITLVIQYEICTYWLLLDLALLIVELWDYLNHSFLMRIPNRIWRVDKDFFFCNEVVLAFYLNNITYTIYYLIISFYFCTHDIICLKLILHTWNK